MIVLNAGRLGPGQTLRIYQASSLTRLSLSATRAGSGNGCDDVCQRVGNPKIGSRDDVPDGVS